ncbi:hypothetical protein [Alkalicoccus urumqiensis]|uniref:hypothetical protein n=1 Tax=Alkalicoccus urumqiensis TaxID=1548213 RepID=UPI0015E616D1|nr:hypothetical protein [Alkalicoccus urumqiensis]
MARNPALLARSNGKQPLLRSPLPVPEQVKGRPTFARPAVDGGVFGSWHDRLLFWHEISALARPPSVLAQNTSFVARNPAFVARNNGKQPLLRSPLPAPEQVKGRP